MPSEKVIIPDRVLEALDLLSVYPDLKADSNRDLASDIDRLERLREQKAMNTIDPQRRASGQSYYTHVLKAIQKALNR